MSAGSGQAGTLLDGIRLDSDDYRQWTLPTRLREISALAMTADHRLLSVDDERAVLYEIDYRAGKLVKAFALGDPVLRGDFEGLAVIGDSIALMSSDGTVYVFSEGADGERVAYEKVETGLGRECEFEGLAVRRPDRELLLLCKDVHRDAGIGGLSVFAWDVATARVTSVIELPEKAIAEALGNKRLHPSGLAVDPATGNLLLVAARERALIELQPDGGFLAARRLLSSTRHPQAEGIELGGNGELILADEGGDGQAMLTVYPGPVE